MVSLLENNVLREWFTAKELAELKLPKLPFSERRVSDKAVRENWREQEDLANKVAPKLGGWRYHISLLPSLARKELKNRARKEAALSLGGALAQDVSAPIAENLQQQTSILGSPDKDCERSGRMAIIRAWLAFYEASNEALSVAQYEFCSLYRKRALMGVDSDLYDLIAPFDPRTLRRWMASLRKEGIDGLLDKRGRKKGQGLLDRAYDGELVRKIEAWVVNQPFLTAKQIRDFIMTDYGEVIELSVSNTGEIATKPMPSLREFSRYIKRFKEEKADIIAEITNPDLYKNAFAPAIGKADQDVLVPNELWEIDASPADALLLEGPSTPGGRWSIYVITDIATRRQKAILTKTPRTQAMLHLVRLAMEDWGVPQQIRTDNGSDFISKDAKSAFHNLGIIHGVCKPFSPEHKPFVERGIGTLQRDFMRTQPGFCGHDVKDRKVIEARKAFAARLGEKDENVFCVELSAEQLQSNMENWCNKLYANAPHSALGGKTPNEVAAEYTGPIWKAPDPRIMALLMSPVPSNDGIRTVGRNGIRVAGGYYWNNVLRVKSKVFVRYDPIDDCRIAVFDKDQTEFLGYAVSLDGLTPAERQAMAREAKRARQPERRREIRKRKSDAALLDIAVYANKRADMYEERANRKAGNIARLPNPQKTHSTPQIEMAKNAFADPLKGPSKPLTPEQEKLQRAIVLELEQARKPAPKKEDAEDRYARALNLEKQISTGQSPAEADLLWLKRYSRSSEYIVRKEAYADHGMPEGLLG